MGIFCFVLGNAIIYIFKAYFWKKTERSWYRTQDPKKDFNAIFVPHIDTQIMLNRDHFYSEGPLFILEESYVQDKQDSRSRGYLPNTVWN